MTFTQFQRAGSNSCYSGKGGGAETRGEQSRNNSAEFPGCLGGSNFLLSLPRAWVQSLAEKLRSYKWCSVAKKEKSNHSVALGQDPGSISKNTHNNIFELFCKTKTSNKMEDIKCLMVFTLSICWLSALWILKEMGIPDHLTCLLRNLYAGQEATVRTGHGTTGWFQIRKGVCQGCILSPCLFNLYAEYIRRNARLDEAHAGIKIAGRNINNLRYADDTTLTAEREELKSLLMKAKRRVKNQS